MNTITHKRNLITRNERDDLRWLACELLASRHTLMVSGDGDGRSAFEHVAAFTDSARGLGALGSDLFSDSLPTVSLSFEFTGFLGLIEGADEVEELFRFQTEERSGGLDDPADLEVAAQGLARVRRARSAAQRVADAVMGER